MKDILIGGARKSIQHYHLAALALRYGVWPIMLLGLLLAGCAASPVGKIFPTPTMTPYQLCVHAYKQPNPVAAENICAGSDGWHMDHPIGAENAIEGFVAPASVNEGGSVQLFVTTTAAQFSFQVYRMGYYQGHGGRLMYTSPNFPGVVQPAPLVDPVTRMVSCDDWSLSATIRVGVTWVSGVYLIKMLSSTGFMRYSLFVVRNDASTSPIAVQLPFLTYQAYNRWGDRNLYRGLDPISGQYIYDDRSYAVSFDRPYNGDPAIYDANAGLGDFPMYDLELLNWLEQHSYNVTYFSDIDLDLNPQIAMHHRVIMVSGHAEYWSTQMRHNITVARDAGISLAFMGANDVYWHVRVASSPLGADRVVICYKSASLDPLSHSDPLATTVRWEDPPLLDPELNLLGQEYGGGVANITAVVLDNGSQPFLTKTTLQVGSTLTGLVGGEYDRVPKTGAPANIQRIASSPLQCVPTDQCPSNGLDITNATIYQATSGAKVFDAGTFQWSWGLSDIRITATSSNSGSDDLPSTQPTSPTSTFTQGIAIRTAPNYSNVQFQQMMANILSNLLAGLPGT